MRITIDKVADAAYIYLKDTNEDGECVHQLVVNDDTITLDFDEHYHLVGIELLNLNLLHPVLKAMAIDITEDSDE